MKKTFQLSSLAAALFAATLGTAHAAAVISNGTVSLGVNDLGQLNYAGVGLKNNATGNDSTVYGCECEGWGAAIASLGVAGYANNSVGTAGLSAVSFASTASTATSVVNVMNGLTPILLVTHNYHPSANAALYQVDVSIQNVSGADLVAGDLLYRRVMDWDIPPTTFNEYVTIQGVPAALGVANGNNVRGTSRDGFSSANPLASRNSSLGPTACAPNDSNFTDCGPADHGALFDFEFEALANGATREFTTYYGSAGNETNMLAALASVGAGLYSLGQPSSPGGPDVGVPNTFAFGFGATGGILNPPGPGPIPEPATLALLGAALAGLGLGRRRKVF